MPGQPRRKLIEVALPLEAINRESIREKSIRHGHPSTLHLWWARRPLAACRAVLFAQLVDDPSAHPEEFPTEIEQDIERQRLFDIIERLVVWENSDDEKVLVEAHAEILKSTNGNPPPILDPFAGGGSIPLEAQRLGLKAHASDLNPVAVLINKALIEIPPKYAGQPPVSPGAADSRIQDWPRATGLAEDVRRYGQWMRDEAEARIGHLYPKATLSDGSKANVIAWIWARTVTCPNPACGIAMPLVRSFWLSKKKTRPTWAVPVVNNGKVHFEIATGMGRPAIEGTVGKAGATCISCQTPVDLTYIRSEGRACRLGSQLVAIVAEAPRQRVYLPANDAHRLAACEGNARDVPETELPEQALGFRVQAYGMTRHRDLFTNRQLVALTTFSDLVGEARNLIAGDAKDAGLGPTAAELYANAVALYLAFAVDRLANESSTICSWDSNGTKQHVRATFSRQALPMTWDYAESQPFSSSTGSISESLRRVADVVDRLPSAAPGSTRQDDATSAKVAYHAVSTDPPYYDNIGYADLADFFYIWLRRSVGSIYSDVTGTMLTPKAAELVATPFLFGGNKKKAEEHFEQGFVRAFTRIRTHHAPVVPISVFYAFKQTESDDSGTASTGWETLLNSLIEAGLMVTATWPIRTERTGRTRDIGSNALASSIVLSCRPRPENAGATTRRGFIASLKEWLPNALREMQGSVAPVDLAQAAIGPGMAVFTGYARVVEADGTDMTVRTALALINQVLDELLWEQVGDFDSDSRFCISWFNEYGWNDGAFGKADELARSRNTSVSGLQRGGVFRAVAGKARLIGPEDLPESWDPLADDRTSVWEVALHIAKALNEKGVDAAAALMATAGQRVDLDTVKELAYLLYNICERRGWAQSAILFNALGTSWSDVGTAARAWAGTHAGTQGRFGFDEDEA